MKTTLFLAILIFITSDSYAQWELFGNTITSTEYVGTDGSSSQPLRLRTGTADAILFQTNGANTRMAVAAGGNVGIGLTAPNYQFQTHLSTASTANYIQVSNSSGSGATDGLLVGLDASGNALLNQQENLPMMFHTNATEKMRLLANGNLGIGIATPGHLLELVSGGDLNLEDGIIRIGDDAMVWRDASNNVAIGVQNDLGALGGAADNTMIGFQAGISLTGGDRNTLIGAEAGDALTTADSCTFIGHNSGTATTTDNNNVFIGQEAGSDNIEGYCNVFVGARASNANTSGMLYNTFMGYRAGKICNEQLAVLRHMNT